MTDSPLPKNDKQNLCIECKLPIPQGASICSHCSSYQEKYKNKLKYVASIAALFIVSGSFILWAISIFPDVKKILFWKNDVRVLSLNAFDSTIIGNFGDGPIFLSHVLLQFPKIHTKYRQKAQRVEFLEQIQPGNIAKRPTYKKEWPTVKFFPKSFVKKEDEAQKILEKAVKEIDCYRIAFSHKNDSFLLESKIMGRDLWTLDSTGYVTYYSSKDYELKQEPIKDIIAFVVQIEDPSKCVDESTP